MNEERERVYNEVGLKGMGLGNRKALRGPKTLPPRSLVTCSKSTPESPSAERRKGGSANVMTLLRLRSEPLGRERSKT